jgi:vacuolar-type H+-ATPase subunit H
MANLEEMFGTEVDETEKIIHEYRQGLSQAIDKVRVRLREQAEEEARQIVVKANEQATFITSQAERKAELLTKQANTEAERAVSEAKRRADSIIGDTEAMLKREAKKRVQAEENKIVKEAEEKADKIVSTARELAQKEAEKAIAESKKEADRVIRELTAESRKELDLASNQAAGIRQEAEAAAEIIKRKAQEEAEYTVSHAREIAKGDLEKESAAIMAEARQKGEEIIGEAKAQAEKERNQLIEKVIDESKRKAELETVQTLAEAKRQAETVARDIKNKLRIELDRATLLITGAQQRLGRTVDEAEKDLISELEAEMLPDLLTPSEEHKATATELPEHKLVADPGADKDKMYEGKLELDIVPPVDSKQKAHLEKLLAEVPNLRVTGRGGSSDGVSWAEIELAQPSPMLSILRQMSPVKEVVAYGNNIIIALKARQYA